MQSSGNNTTQPDRDQVATTAYTLWEQAGRPAGRDVEFWVEAERRIQRIQDPRTKPVAGKPTRRAPVSRQPASAPSPAAPAPPPASAPAPAHSASWSPMVLRKRKGRSRAAHAARAGDFTARQAGTA